MHGIMSEAVLPLSSYDWVKVTQACPQDSQEALGHSQQEAIVTPRDWKLSSCLALRTERWCSICLLSSRITPLAHSSQLPIIVPYWLV
jgi:hypothetical protein